MTSNQNSNIFCMLKSYDKYGPIYHMLMCLKQCCMSSKQCRPGSVATFCGVWSRFTWFVQDVRRKERRTLSNVPARNEDTDQTGGMLSLIRAFGISIYFDDICFRADIIWSKKSDSDLHRIRGPGNGVILALSRWTSGRGSNPPRAEFFSWLSDVHLMLSHCFSPETNVDGTFSTNIPNICMELFRFNWAFFVNIGTFPEQIAIIEMFSKFRIFSECACSQRV